MAAQKSHSPMRKRHSQVKVMPGAVVCTEAELKGDITIGSRTVVHPKARIIAEGGPIVIGESNLIEEQVLIINRADKTAPEPVTMEIGVNNVFEVGCNCESLRIGDNNVVEAKARVGRQTELSSGCVIGSYCEVSSKEVIPDNTVVYGKKCVRRVQGERPQPQTLQLDFLMKILPNYHHLRKQMKPQTK
ncbi:dynactin subunit 6-like isoform X2 [Branchiostoma lanceolatum]|uniref:dynactin subunit 6-like isoform X2 n=1 Tax=Branchiostoma lanceolatum TaxID=7740 RepID=UPI003451CBFC